jgi:DNA-binding LacI/PurR family transcriptional regulator
MVDQSVSEQAREAVLQAILERNLIPNAGVVHNKT